MHLHALLCTGQVLPLMAPHKLYMISQLLEEELCPLLGGDGAHTTAVRVIYCRTCDVPLQINHRDYYKIYHQAHFWVSQSSVRAVLQVVALHPVILVHHSLNVPPMVPLLLVKKFSLYKMPGHHINMDLEICCYLQFLCPVLIMWYTVWTCPDLWPVKVQ